MPPAPATAAPALRPGPPAPDVLIAGAGAFGLWTARACRARGLSVALCDVGRIGDPAGASATPVGALAPHRPTPWTPLKALQFEAIGDLPARLAALEAETGLATGAGRPGRLAVLSAPLPEAPAPPPWPGFTLRHIPAPPGLEAPHGVLADDLTARLDPPRTAAALRAALAAAGVALHDADPLRAAESPAAARLASGPRPAGALVLAAGAAAFDPLPAELRARLPRLEPEHGQAARLAVALDLPVIQAPGLWIVPHADGTTGLGATAERGRADAGVTDGGLDAVLAAAARLLPALAGAPVLARWSGLRPRLASRRPLAGEVAPGLFVAAGGWKTGLALAPVIADALAEALTGAPNPLPPELRPA